jgi:2,5-diketo-D-gluconate reductase B
MIHLETDGARMPALGFGTFRLTGDGCRRALLAALETGYRHIDTAEMYGNEAAVGRAIRESGLPRALLWVTTKVWYTNLARDALRRSALASLDRLGLDHVDLLLIHWPTPGMPLGEALAAMAELQDEGRVRHLGVSNFPTALVRDALDVHGARLLVDQVEYHPHLAQRRLLPYLRERGMWLTAYSPLARGRIARDPVLADIAARHGKTPAQVALRWLLQQDGVAAIPKASRPERMRENIGIFDLTLDDGEMARIHGLARGHRLADPAWGVAWDPD